MTTRVSLALFVSLLIVVALGRIAFSHGRSPNVDVRHVATSSSPTATSTTDWAARTPKNSSSSVSHNTVISCNDTEVVESPNGAKLVLQQFLGRAFSSTSGIYSGVCRDILAYISPDGVKRVLYAVATTTYSEKEEQSFARELLISPTGRFAFAAWSGGFDNSGSFIFDTGTGQDILENFPDTSEIDRVLWQPQDLWFAFHSYGSREQLATPEAVYVYTNSTGLKMIAELSFGVATGFSTRFGNLRMCDGNLDFDIVADADYNATGWAATSDCTGKNGNAIQAYSYNVGTGGLTPI